MEQRCSTKNTDILHRVYAEDTIRTKRRALTLQERMVVVAEMKLDIDTACLADYIEIIKGIRVIFITINVATDLDLANGSTGVIEVLDAGEEPMVPHQLRKMQANRDFTGTIPIFPCE